MVVFRTNRDQELLRQLDLVDPGPVDSKGLKELGTVPNSFRMMDNDPDHPRAGSVSNLNPVARHSCLWGEED